jgi:hypothetical protein
MGRLYDGVIIVLHLPATVEITHMLWEQQGQHFASWEAT